MRCFVLFSLTCLLLTACFAVQSPGVDGGVQPLAATMQSVQPTPAPGGLQKDASDATPLPSEPLAKMETLTNTSNQAQTLTADAAQILELPAGASGLLRISVAPDCCPEWTIENLPQGASTEIPPAANPAKVRIQINSPRSLVPGDYPFEVVANWPDKIRRLPALLRIIPCEEFRPGNYTQSIDASAQAIVAGKPDYKNGVLIPLQICDSARPRHLTFAIEATTSEAGSPLAAPPPIYLFRSWVWPQPDHIIAHNITQRNVARYYVQSSSGQFEMTATPGLYLLFIQHDEYQDLIEPKAPNEIPQTVSYQVALQDVPTLCDSDETIFLSCQIKDSDKILSVCASEVLDQENGYVQYRFGKDRQAVELAHPSNLENSRHAFRFSIYTRYMVSYLNLSFQINDYRFDVYDDYYAELGEEVKSSGVYVAVPGGDRTDFQCREPIVSKLGYLSDVVPREDFPR